MRRKSLLVTLVIAAASVPAFATPAPSVQPPQYDLTIERQSLSSALQEFAKQSGVQIIFFSRVTDGHEAAPLSGRFTAVAALARLLNDAPELAFRELNANTIEVLPKEAVNRLDNAYASSTRGGGTEDAVLKEGEGQARSFWSRLRLAQTGPASNADTQGAEGSQANTQSTNQDSQKRIPIEEIVVTAQKREEKAQNVPISISVLSGRDLDRSTAEGINEALRGVPGVTAMVGSLGGGTQLNVRGVTAANAILTGSSPVGYYLDSVPFSLVRSAVTPDSNAYDLERVEVLRGPQGTLYGASSTNGVVRVLTKDAALDRFELKARTSGSTTKDARGNYRGDMAINVPIIEGKLAARAVVGYEDMSGWIDRVNREDANDAQLLSMRLKVNAQPTDQFSIGLSAWLSRNDFSSRSTGSEARTNISRVEEPISTDYNAFGLKAIYDFPTVSFSSMTSYLDYQNDSVLDYEAIFGPGAPGAACCLNTVLFTGFDSRIMSQEINLASTSPGPWRWTAGAIYRDGVDHFFQWRRQYLNPAGSRFDDSSESFAVFGELTRIFLDNQLELTAGLRYFEDEQVMEEIARLNQIVPNPPFFVRKETFDAVSPRFTLTWHPGDDLMVYASYAEGFRSGFSQISTVLLSAPSFPPVDSDNLTNYELGAKGAVLDGRLSFDTAVYYIDWQDIQQSLSVQTTSGTGTLFNVSAPINGESAGGLGVEFGLTVRPVSALQLGLNFSWNDLKLDADVFNALSGGAQVRLFQKGDRLVLSPEYIAGIWADYAFPLAGGYEGSFSASANYTSSLETRSAVSGALVITEGDNILLSRAALSVNSSSARWGATLFVDNLADEKGRFIPNGNPVENVRLRPRTAGLQVEFRY